MKHAQRWSVVVATVCLLAGASAGGATIVVDEDPTDEWHVGHLVLALGDPPLFKRLIFNEDKDFSGYVDNGDVFIFINNPPKLIETIEIAPGSAPWEDWHEQILSPNWIWTKVDVVAPGLTNLEVSIDGNVVDLTFDPVGPGSPGMTIQITKEMRYDGDPYDLFPNIFWPAPVPGEVFIEVLEYPTPEPATLSLLALGALAALRRRRAMGR